MLKSKIFVVISCLIGNFFAFSPLYANEVDKNNNISCENLANNNNHNAGENFSVNLKFDSSEELEEYFNNNFIFQIEFNNNILKYEKFKYVGKFRKKALKVSKNGNIVQISHDFEETPKRRPKNLTDFSENFEFFFDIKKNCKSCNTDINFKFININTNQIINIRTENINITGDPEVEQRELQKTNSEPTHKSPKLNITKNTHNITARKKEKPIKNSQKPKVKSCTKSKNISKNKTKKPKKIDKTNKSEEVSESVETSQPEEIQDNNNTEIIIEPENNMSNIRIYLIIAGLVMLILICFMYKFIKNKAKN